MLKSQLVEKMAGKLLNETPERVEQGVTELIRAMQEALCQGRRIEVRGFGGLERRIRKGRKARNPRTGESVQVEERVVVHFKPGMRLRQRVDKKTES